MADNWLHSQLLYSYKKQFSFSVKPQSGVSATIRATGLNVWLFDYGKHVVISNKRPIDLFHNSCFAVE